MKLPGFHRRWRNMQKLEDQFDRMVAAQASEWVQVMRAPGSADRAVFARWLKQHERHADEYMLMEAVDRAMNDVDPQRRIDVQALLAMPDSQVLALPTDKPLAAHRPRHTRSRRWAIGFAAAAAVAAISFFALPFSLLGWQDIHTTTGEQRVLELADGSTVYLNTQSRIQTRFNKHSREVRLLAGEALFKVERDPTRPFHVEAGDTRIRVLGTQFNVQMSRASTEVAVLEGRVEISQPASLPASAPTQLGAGEAARIPENQPLVKQTAPDLTQAIAWRERRVMFRMDTLADIAAEFNRYNRLQRIRITDDAIAGRRYSGVFDADDPMAFARMLAGDEALNVASGRGEILIGATQ